VSLAPTTAEIDHGVSAALKDLYAHNEAAKALGVIEHSGESKGEPLLDLERGNPPAVGIVPRAALQQAARNVVPISPIAFHCVTWQNKRKEIT
jgi:hypothetical protein